MRNQTLIAAAIGMSFAVHGGIAFVPPTAAQEASGTTLEEIVVTATRHEEPLQDVPLAVTAITGQEIQNYSAGLEYDFDLNDTWSGWARADWAYVGQVRSELGALPRESYNTVNLRFGVMVDNLAVEIFGRNLTDERGVSSVEPLPFGGEQTLIRPREVGVQVRYGVM